VDLEQALHALETLDPTFEYVGALLKDYNRVLSDGQCASQMYSKLNLCAESEAAAAAAGGDRWWKEPLREGKCVGIVYNSDTYSGPGQHWSAIFVSFRREAPLFGVYYYDSVAMRPPVAVASLLQSVHQDVHGSEPRFEYRCNRVRAQFRDTECGMYAVLFLYGGCLSGCSFDEICRDMPRDNQVNRYRRVLFTPTCAPPAADENGMRTLLENSTRPA
jgi:hypothetical protein